MLFIFVTTTVSMISASNYRATTMTDFPYGNVGHDPYRTRRCVKISSTMPICNKMAYKDMWLPNFMQHESISKLTILTLNFKLNLKAKSRSKSKYGVTWSIAIVITSCPSSSVHSIRPCVYRICPIRRVTCSRRAFRPVANCARRYAMRATGCSYF